jgi:glycosyltransferase involved in cell wall biosynthesis
MKTVEIAVLSYNEEKNLPTLLEQLAQVRSNLSGVDFTVVVVNNGSTDNTEEALSRLEKEHPFVRHITIPINQGYGYGVAQGLSAVQGDVVGFMWGDNQFDPAIIATMLQVFQEKEAVQLVKTFRTKRYDGASRLFISKMYQIIFRVLYGIYTNDINSGPKLFRSSFLASLQPFRSTDWFIDAEIMIKATRAIKPAQVVEFPITFHPRKFGKSNVRFSACFQFLFNLLKYKFVKL